MPAQQRYWARAQRVTAVLFSAWLLTTFCVIFFARELSGYSLFGWPFSYYMAAQGTTLIYLAIVGLYAWRMRHLDLRCEQERQQESQQEMAHAPQSGPEHRHGN